MGNELVAPSDAALTAAAAVAAEFAQASKSANTRRAYAADWRDFDAWCTGLKLVALPAKAATVALYIGSLATRGLKAKTIARRLTAIRAYHRDAGRESPAEHPGVKATLDGIRRTLGTAPNKKAALTAELLARAIKKIPPDLAGLRDRALILLGFAAALRRSELVGLNLTDIERHPKGIVVRLRRSKTDQAGAGFAKAVPHGHRLKPVAALDAWLEAMARALGVAGSGALAKDTPLFRGVCATRVKPNRLCDKQVARIVKKRAAQIGLDAAAFAGHSLRSGFLTSAGDAGADPIKMAKHAGHAKLDTTLGYVQVADAFREHAGRRFL